MVRAMKKFLMLLLVMLTIYLGVQIAFFYFGKGHETFYKLNNFDVKEIYTARTDNESDSYYIEINTGKNIFNIQTYENFHKTKKIITNIQYIKTNQYECIYPTFKDNLVNTDILCINNNIIYNYQTIKGKDKTLDSKISQMGTYNGERFKDTSKGEIMSSGRVIYKENILKNHYLAFPTLKGMGLINNYLKSKWWYTVDLFKNDVLNPTIFDTVSKYYVIPDYTGAQSFTQFNVVDMVEGTNYKITCRNSISVNSYVMGTIGNIIYLYDITNQKQYEINPIDKDIIEVGNASIGIKFYSDGKWVKMNSVNVTKTKPQFIYSNITGYDRIDLVGGEKTGYIYYYKKGNNGYDVYRSARSNTEILTYLFNTETINNVKYYRNYVYYQDNRYLKYYHDSTYIKRIYYIASKEFSGNINFGLVYSE